MLLTVTYDIVSHLPCYCESLAMLLRVIMLLSLTALLCHLQSYSIIVSHIPCYCESLTMLLWVTYHVIISHLPHYCQCPPSPPYFWFRSARRVQSWIANLGAVRSNLMYFGWESLFPVLHLRIFWWIHSVSPNSSFNDKIIAMSTTQKLLYFY